MLKNVGLILAALVLTTNTDAAVPRRSVPDVGWQTHGHFQGMTPAIESILTKY
jgi:hypothetical protein